MKLFAGVALLSVLATGALAHSKLAGSTPSDGTVIAALPGEMTLSFNKKIRLTLVMITRGDASGIKADLTGHKGFGTHFAVPLTGSESGVYRVEWRGLGVDGHAMQGDFSFTVE
jgi:hypothetical protein